MAKHVFVSGTKQGSKTKHGYVAYNYLLDGSKSVSHSPVYKTIAEAKTSANRVVSNHNMNHPEHPLRAEIYKVQGRNRILVAKGYHSVPGEPFLVWYTGADLYNTELRGTKKAR